MVHPYQLQYQDKFTKLRFTKKGNNTQNLYWFSPQENLHPIVLRFLRTSTIRESSTNTMYIQFSKILLFPWTLQEKSQNLIEPYNKKFQELKPHQLRKPLVTLTKMKKVEINQNWIEYTLMYISQHHHSHPLIINSWWRMNESWSNWISWRNVE